MSLQFFLSKIDNNLTITGRNITLHPTLAKRESYSVGTQIKSQDDVAVTR